MHRGASLQEGCNNKVGVMTGGSGEEELAEGEHGNAVVGVWGGVA